jgi:hypothetical protein
MLRTVIHILKRLAGVIALVLSGVLLSGPLFLGYDALTPNYDPGDYRPPTHPFLRVVVLTPLSLLLVFLSARLLTARRFSSGKENAPDAPKPTRPWLPLLAAFACSVLIAILVPFIEMVLMDSGLM